MCIYTGEFPLKKKKKKTALLVSNNFFFHFALVRLLTAGSIEEKIFQRQLIKAGLNESIVDPNCKKSVKLSKEEIMV